MDALDRHGRVLCSHDTPPYGPGLAVSPAGALGRGNVAGDEPVDRRGRHRSAAAARSPSEGRPRTVSTYRASVSVSVSVSAVTARLARTGYRVIGGQDVGQARSRDAGGPRGPARSPASGAVPCLHLQRVGRVGLEPTIPRIPKGSWNETTARSTCDQTDSLRGSTCSNGRRRPHFVPRTMPRAQPRRIAVSPRPHVGPSRTRARLPCRRPPRAPAWGLPPSAAPSSRLQRTRWRSSSHRASPRGCEWA